MNYGFTFKNTWSGELSEVNPRALPVSVPLPAAALNQVSGRGRASRVLPLLRAAEGRVSLPLLRLDWPVWIYFLEIFPLDLHVIFKHIGGFTGRLHWA